MIGTGLEATTFMPIPIIQVSQMRQWEEATWAAGRKEVEVISRVGHIVTQRACQMTRPGDLIVVFAGKGHNGDDARQSSQNFSDREVMLINVADPTTALDEFLSQLSLQPALIIDGLFGVGLNRPFSEKWIRLVDAINDARIPILSIDVPSGLNADTGDPQGTSIRATVTLTLAAPKRGLVTAAAWSSVGRLEVARDIGLVPDRPLSELLWTERDDFRNYPPPRPVAGHKGSFGHLGIVAGSMGYHGAAILAARGASQAQPGLVTVYTSEETYVPVACQLQSAMVKPWTDACAGMEPHTAVLFGPGLADANLSPRFKDGMVRVWRDAPIPVVADASGLDWLPPGEGKTSSLRVITPHPGEAARLLKASTGDIQEDRPKTVIELSKRWGDCWVVLKGHQSLIGRSTGPMIVNSSGNPSLGQGGSGDILAGYLSGLLAQPELQREPQMLLAYGVWQHGAAADVLSSRKRNWPIEELIPVLGGCES